MLLCQVVEKILPLGRNMWEQFTSQYNANRTRSAPERDLESPKRNFKSIYVKPKPTGQGEVPLRLKPVIWAKELQQKIELEGGIHTSHDGLDQGGDDASLQEEVDEVTTDGGGGGPSSQHPPWLQSVLQTKSETVTVVGTCSHATQALIHPHIQRRPVQQLTVAEKPWIRRTLSSHSP
jgi:hypothetical protein